MSDTMPPVRPVYRLYIDEVGHASLKIGLNEEERYLCLTGVACQLGHVQATIQPQMEHLKRFFVREAQAQAGWQDPDEQPAVAKPVVFHRKEMVTCAFPFEALAKAGNQSRVRSGAAGMPDRLGLHRLQRRH